MSQTYNKMKENNGGTFGSGSQSHLKFSSILSLQFTFHRSHTCYQILKSKSLIGTYFSLVLLECCTHQKNWTIKRWSLVLSLSQLSYDSSWYSELQTAQIQWNKNPEMSCCLRICNSQGLVKIQPFVNLKPLHIARVKLMAHGTNLTLVNILSGPKGNI